MKLRDDLKILKNKKDVFFQRPSTDPMTLFEIATQQKKYESNFNFDVDIKSVEDDIEFQTMDFINSFGEFLNEVLIKHHLTIPESCEKLALRRSYFEEILNDKILPWDIGIEYFKKIIEYFHIDKKQLLSIIEQQPITNDQLKPKISNDFIAARADKSLSDKERRKAMQQALLHDARMDEERERKEFIQCLKML